MNAKELALAKLKASINLASMHTYLLMMGVPFEAVLNYTAKSELFNDLYNLCKSDGWTDSKGKVNNAVWNVLKNNVQLKNRYTITEVELLRKLYNWALEFRRFTLLLGINQGMNSLVAKSVLFKNQFRTLIGSNIDAINQFLLGNDKIIWSTKVSDIIANPKLRNGLFLVHGLEYSPELDNTLIQKAQKFIDTYGDLSLMLDIDPEKYFKNETYRELVTNLYDFVKFSINIPDAINNLPHFYSMLSATNDILLKTSRSAKGKYVFNDFIKKFDPASSGLNAEELSVYKVPLYITEQAIADTLNLVDDYLISSFLTSINDLYKFNYLLNSSDNSKKVEVSFDTTQGLSNLTTFFDVMLARLKNFNPHNELLRNLIHYENKKGFRLIRLGINLDILNSENAGEQQLKRALILGGFNEIMNIPINSKELFPEIDSTLTVGDIFFLYNLIYNYNKRGQNSLTALFDQYILTRNLDSIYITYLQTIAEYDLDNRNIDIDKLKLNQYLVLRYLPKNRKDASILVNLKNIKRDLDIIESYLTFLNAYKNGFINIEIDPNCD